jgi:hypothetical protein
MACLSGDLRRRGELRRLPATTEGNHELDGRGHLRNLRIQIGFSGAYGPLLPRFLVPWSTHSSAAVFYLLDRTRNGLRVTRNGAIVSRDVLVDSRSL